MSLTIRLMAGVPLNSVAPGRAASAGLPVDERTVDTPV